MKPVSQLFLAALTIICIVLLTDFISMVTGGHQRNPIQYMPVTFFCFAIQNCTNNTGPGKIVALVFVV